jgi:putative spermidine/putrescine transport system ATP-binding protein
LSAPEKASEEIAVELKSVTHRFGAVQALENVSFSVKAGEFFGMLGPSGSGKTTCLRILAGFEQPSVGEVLINGKPVAGLPPHERDVHTVFQDYALFPHMTVAQNIGFPLMIAKVPAAERAYRVATMLERIKLQGFGDRRPGELSGGQRQRVALARSLIDGPSVLLLDEPLGALDLKLREEMQRELKDLQRGFGITFIFVTHDQSEALAMSDRLVVFDKGRVEQIGTPGEVYEHPRTAFVANFVGSANLIAGAVAASLPGAPPRFAIRQERIAVAAPESTPAPGLLRLTGTLIDTQYLGADCRYTLKLAGGTLLHAMMRGHRSGLKTGEAAAADFAPADMIPLSS